MAAPRSPATAHAKCPFGDNDTRPRPPNDLPVLPMIRKLRYGAAFSYWSTISAVFSKNSRGSELFRRRRMHDGRRVAVVSGMTVLRGLAFGVRDDQFPAEVP